MEILAQGAEAIIYRKENNLIKERVPKTYRLPIIDSMLRKTRHRKEVKILKDLQAKNISSPKLISEDESSMKITMEFLDGPKLRDILSKKNISSLAKEIGTLLSQLHNMDIIHGDLTTSNMMYCKEKVYFIDFGLSFYSTKVEDKAVDLHLLHCAIESRHPELFEELFGIITETYFTLARDAQLIKKRYIVVEKRGRNKTQH